MKKDAERISTSLLRRLKGEKFSERGIYMEKELDFTDKKAFYYDLIFMNPPNIRNKKRIIDIQL